MFNSTTSAPARRFAQMLALCVALALASVVLPSARPAHALGIGTVIVKSITDTDDGTKDACTLREALQSVFAANSGGSGSYHECSGAVSGANTITFATSGTIKLTTTLPDIVSIVTITGPMIIDGGGPGTVMLRVSGSNSDTTILSIAGLTLTNGGHAILVTNGGTVNIAGSAFIGNAFDGSGGAAIDSNGPLNIAGATFTGNKAPSGGGGAIRMSGTGKLNIGGTVFSGNTAKLSGGAILASADINLTDVVFNGNIASGDDGNSDGATAGGGAVFYAGSTNKTLTITRGIFNGNLAPKGSGGAIFVGIDSSVTIKDSSFQGNLAGTPTNDRQGGAIANIGGKIDIRRSTLLNNGVVGNGGAIANDRRGQLALTNAAITANAATGKGGGVYNNNTQQGSPITPATTVLNTTIALNVAPAGGSIFNMAQAPFTVGNTIIADGCAGGVLTSQGHNLDSGTSCGLADAGDISSQAPNLDAPFFNGGPLSQLLTQKLKPGSPALDAGDPAICAADPVANQDIRSKPRPQDGNGDGTAVCDIGAFEDDGIAAGFGSSPVAPGPIVVGSAVANNGSVNATFAVFNTGDAPLTVNAPALSGGAAGDFAVDPNLSLAIQPGDPQQTIQVTCSPKALGVRIATLTLKTNDQSDASPAFTLLCTGTATPAPAFGSTPAAPGPLSIGAVLGGAQGSATLVLKNLGDAPLTVDTLALAGINPGDFSVPAGFSATIAAGASKDLPVTCSPQGLGIRTATLTLKTNDAARPSPSFDVTCTGTTPPTPALVPVNGGSLNVVGPPNPYGTAVSPDGKNVYVRNLGGIGIRIYQRDPLTGDLSSPTFISITNLKGDVEGAGLVIVSPDGRNVYATGAGATNANAGQAAGALVAFSRDPNTGGLTVLSTHQQGDSYGICILPGCTLPKIQGLGGAYGMALSPDGQYLYVSGYASNSITVLRRDTATGSLQFFGAMVVEEIASAANLGGVYGIALSPDGQHLYAANYGNNSVSVFSRNGADGKLTFVEQQQQGVAGVDGLTGVFRVAVSPDGNNVYTAAYGGDAVAAFGRSVGSGKLAFLDAYKNGTGGLSSLDAGTSVVVGPDGAHVFATAYNGKSVVVFERNGATGLLKPNQEIVRAPLNGTPANPALAGARDLALSADGATAYISAYSDNAVVTLKAPNPTPAIDSLGPASATAGGAGFTLNVQGSGFLPSSVVQWNGSPRPTTYSSPTLLKATISAADIATGGPFPALVPITVVNPAPGGGTSNSVSFSITGPNENPVPAIERLSPLSATAGAPGFTLLVVGSSYIPTSQVQWNGQSRPTIYVAPTALQVQISAADIAQPGVVGVTVINAGPGGGSSNAKPFTSSAPGENSRPTIVSLSPLSIVAGSLAASELTLTVGGAGFTSDSQGQWNGENRATTYVSSAQITLSINAADLSEIGAATITVVNPSPGGGASNPASFQIGRPGDNPIPAIAGAGVVPGSAAAGTITLSVTGSGFIAGSQAQWNGQSRPITVVNDTQLTITLTSSDFSSGSAIVTVVNPAPGGGTSNEWFFGVKRLFLPLATR